MAATDLVGLGMAPALADLIALTSSALTATGTAQADAAPMLTDLVDMTATGADGIKLPLNVPIGSLYAVFNSSGSTGLVYCGLGETMDTTSNGSLSVTTHKLAIFIKYGVGKWGSILA